MVFLAVLILLGTGLTVNSEKHSLTYIYTAFSKPVKLRGIHEFTAAGLLDGRMIYYYDSEGQKTLPKQDWVKEGLNPEYWKTCTQSRNYQQWLKNNMHILMNRTTQNDPDIHVLQWMRGCEGEVQSDDSLKFVRGMDMYNYNGNDLLSFNIVNQVWVADTDIADKMKESLDVDKEITLSYLKKECIESLSKFMVYRKKQLFGAPKPDVFMFAKKAKEEENIVLTCLATGFYPKDIVLQIRRNGRVLSKEDGLQTTGVRPNEDDTFQRKDEVEILKADMSDYTCEVIHKASNLSVERKWDHRLPDDGKMNAIIITLGALLLSAGIVAVVVFILCRKQKPQGSNSPPTQVSASCGNDPKQRWNFSMCSKDSGLY
ncbi:H-2 class I histocompatibility antigen, L-D alpha chain-like [Melanotaenia boesemani]|uniref:H-2 class I histocompatibility antigen, L-D alpha chain-like n=1 Tax=Melanotaenia boesemani TaxID=1250792 RepID=UPI001C04CBD9|nr:H-2 class I histocompatibility antigen, L-D alpha chain-like [Melanotaenia boesemani]